MKFGVREIANVVFRAKNDQNIGGVPFKQGQPVFYLDTAKTSSMEGAATTVYATGGRGNVRLIAWEGERTLTFTVEDALLSPISFAMLSGAGLVKGISTDIVHFHQTTTTVTDASGHINLNDALVAGETICPSAPIYVMLVDEGGDLTGSILNGYKVPTDSYSVNSQDDTTHIYVPVSGDNWVANRCLKAPSTTDSTYYNKTVIVDYYVQKAGNKVSELQIDMGHFGGYYYVEADTLFRSQHDGKDYPANLTFPNVKIQSNFTFSMAATGDPSTFTFTMDAFPGYTYFEPSKKVLCAIQIADDNLDLVETQTTVFPHRAGESSSSNMPETQNDSVVG